MLHPPESAVLILQHLAKVTADKKDPSQLLYHTWGTLALMQAKAVAAGIQHAIGNKVYSGPFKGMQLTPAALTGAFAPHLLGCYETELHPAAEWVVKQPYKHILNIGSSVGYYAVGFALRMPNVKVHAFEIVPETQQKCREMAALNNVQDRVTVSGEFYGKDFASYPPYETLAFVDIEGGEVELLDPEKFPALKKMDVIVELHDVFNPNISAAIRERFTPTHNVEIIYNRTYVADISGIIGKNEYVDPFDHFMMSWELRNGPTPWAVMKAKR